MKHDSLKDRVFGRLTVKEKVVDIDNYKIVNHLNGTWWRCVCECGNVTIVRRYALISGNTRSCGCMRVENARRAGLIKTGRFTTPVNKGIARC